MNERPEIDQRELVILVLETVRDDTVQAQTNDGRRVADPSDVQSILMRKSPSYAGFGTNRTSKKNTWLGNQSCCTPKRRPWRVR